jgi:hypothetical protein
MGGAQPGHADAGSGRYPPALMTAVVVVASFVTFNAGSILEREWALQPGSGHFLRYRVWFVAARRTTIGTTALARPIRRAARGVMAITTRALAFASRWFDEATVRRTFEPLIADWQREWQDASPSRRARVSLRGLAALSAR